MNRRRTLPFSLAVAFLIAACGSSGSSDPTDDPCVGSACADRGARDGGSSTDGGGRTCTPRCGTDFDCASTCPSGGNVHCCDLPTGTCYQNASAVCTHTPDSGSGDSGGLPYP
jgi:hypothetical protein